MKHSFKTPLMAVLCMAASAVMLLLAAAPEPAGAYVLEGPHILDLTADAMGRIGAIKVNQKLIVYPQPTEKAAASTVFDQPAQNPPAPTVFDETAIYVMPERFRSDLESDRIQRTHLVFGDSSLTVIDGRLAVGQDPFDLYQRLLRSRSRTRLMKTLNQLGVETAISSLGRVDDTVVYVLGAHYPDESVSQLAIDKDSFLPLRLLLVGGDADTGDSRLEIYYRDWQKVQSGWFPYHIQFYTAGRLAREIRVSDIHPDPSLPPDFMDLEALKASVAQREADTPRGQKQDAVKAVQQAVHDFQKKFE
jgi:hypothetical protein